MHLLLRQGSGSPLEGLEVSRGLFEGGHRLVPSCVLCGELADLRYVQYDRLSGQNKKLQILSTRTPLLRTEPATQSQHARTAEATP